VLVQPVALRRRALRLSCTPEPRDLEDLYKRSRGEGFGAEVKRRIMTGTYVLSAGYYDAYYLKAQQRAAAHRDDFRRAFESVDVIVGPTSPPRPSSWAPRSTTRSRCT
jgi:Asp-tRNA(Asn)/Glu-tRNA(Gln) amidotransferase A subunit family amidase